MLGFKRVALMVGRYYCSIFIVHNLVIFKIITTYQAKITLSFYAFKIKSTFNYCFLLNLNITIIIISNHIIFLMNLQQSISINDYHYSDNLIAHEG